MGSYNPEEYPDFDFDDIERRRFDADQEAMYQAAEANGKAHESEYDPGFEYFSPKMKDFTIRLQQAVAAENKEAIKILQIEMNDIEAERLMQLAREYDLEGPALEDWYNHAFEDVTFIIHGFIKDSPVLAMLIRPFMSEFKAMVRAMVIYGYIRGKAELVESVDASN